MDEKKKTSSNKSKSATTKKATPKKKTTTKNASSNNAKKQTNKSTQAPSKTVKKQPAKKQTTKEVKNKPVEIKKDPKEDTKKLTPVIKEAKEKNKEVNNKPAGESESVKVEKQIKKRFAGQNDEMSKLIKIVLIVTALMLVFYGITLLVTKKADEVTDSNGSNKEQAETSIQYDNIVIGTMLNKGGSYYVLIKADGDNRAAEYDTLIQTIKAGEDAPTIYTANLTDAFNKSYLAKEENYYAENIADFKVTGTTLVKINEGKVETVYDNYDKIKNQLNELS